MQKKIQKFKNEQFGEIRTMVDEKGQSWFIGKDVAMMLGYKNVPDAIGKHVDIEDKGVAKCDTLGGSRLKWNKGIRHEKSRSHFFTKSFFHEVTIYELRS